MPAADCPQCELVHNGSATNSGHEDPPGPGDLTICLFCDAVLAYTDDMQLRLGTLIENAELLGKSWLDARITLQLIEP